MPANTSGTVVSVVSVHQALSPPLLTALPLPPAQDMFIKYYDSVMPLLLNILMHANDKSQRLLRAKTVESISLVGMAVGKERFREDAAKLMTFLQTAQMAQLDNDDPLAGYMLQVGGRADAAVLLDFWSARGTCASGTVSGMCDVLLYLLLWWLACLAACVIFLLSRFTTTSTPLLQAGARLCKCLGDEFLPYLPIVMPALLKSAQIEADIKVGPLRLRLLQCHAHCMLHGHVVKVEAAAVAQRCHCWLAPAVLPPPEAGPCPCPCSHPLLPSPHPSRLPPPLHLSQIRDLDEEDDEDEEDDDVESFPLGDKVVSIRTSGLEEKATACNMLCCYASELKEGFFPFTKQVGGWRGWAEQCVGCVPDQHPWAEPACPCPTLAPHAWQHLLWCHHSRRHHPHHHPSSSTPCPPGHGHHGAPHQVLLPRGGAQRSHQVAARPAQVSVAAAETAVGTRAPGAALLLQAWSCIMRTSASGGACSTSPLLGMRTFQPAPPLANRPRHHVAPSSADHHPAPPPQVFHQRA